MTFNPRRVLSSGRARLLELWSDEIHSQPDIKALAKISSHGYRRWSGSISGRRTKLVVAEDCLLILPFRPHLLFGATISNARIERVCYTAITNIDEASRYTKFMFVTPRAVRLTLNSGRQVSISASKEFLRQLRIAWTSAHPGR